MILCVYCSERATVRRSARGWRRFSCVKHSDAVLDQAKALRRNFVTTRNADGFHNDGRCVGVRVYRPSPIVDDVRQPKRRGDGPTRRERDAESKRRNANRALSVAHQLVFDKLVKVRGVTGAALALGVSEPAIEKLRYGGASKPATVARIEQALAVQP